MNKLKMLLYYLQFIIAIKLNKNKLVYTNKRKIGKTTLIQKLNNKYRGCYILSGTPKQIRHNYTKLIGKHSLTILLDTKAYTMEDANIIKNLLLNLNSYRNNVIGFVETKYRKDDFIWK